MYVQDPKIKVPQEKQTLQSNSHDKWKHKEKPQCP